MRTIHLAAALALSALAAVAGCAAQTNHVADAEETDEQGNAISLNADQLVAGWNLQAGSKTLGFGHLALKSDGTYFTETVVTCIKYPCPSLREEGTWHSTSFDKKLEGSLSLHPTGHASRKYTVSLASDGSGMKLGRSSVIAYFDKVLNYCDDSSDCPGQKIYALGLLCRVGQSYHTVCDPSAHMCQAKCMDSAPCQVSGCGVYCGTDTKVCNKLLTKGTAQCYADVGHCGRDVAGKCGWLDQERIDACLVSVH